MARSKTASSRRPPACRPRPRRGQQFSQRACTRPHARRGAAEIGDARRAARQELDEIAARLVEAGLVSWAGAADRATSSSSAARPICSATCTPGGPRRIRPLFADLETKTDVIDLLHRAETGDGVKIFIGSENKLFSLSGSSMIAAPLRAATIASPACSALSGRPGSITAVSCRWSNMRRKCWANSSARARAAAHEPDARRMHVERVECRDRSHSLGDAIEHLRGKWAGSSLSACCWSSWASQR